MTLTIRRAEKAFAEYLNEAGYNQSTINNRLAYLKRFNSFLHTRIDIRDINKSKINDYFLLLSETDLKRSTKQMIISTIRLYFKALYLKELILLNPGEDSFKLPSEKNKPKEAMKEIEVQQFLDGIDIKAPLYLRDRAIFELIYSSGLRAGEAASLTIEDLDWNNRTLLIHHAKNKRDRIVPVNEVAMKFLKLYAGNRKSGYIFIGRNESLSTSSINNRFKFHLKIQDLYRKGLSIHSLRHSVAVHLLSSGVDLRYVQELLGHDSIESTVIYTNQIYDELKKFYRTHHPRENEYYKEVDSNYIKRVQDLKKHILNCRKKRG